MNNMIFLANHDDGVASPPLVITSEKEERKEAAFWEPTATDLYVEQESLSISKNRQEFRIEDFESEYKHVSTRNRGASGGSS